MSKQICPRASVRLSAPGGLLGGRRYAALPGKPELPCQSLGSATGGLLPVRLEWLGRPSTDGLRRCSRASVRLKSGLSFYIAPL